MLVRWSLHGSQKGRLETLLRLLFTFEKASKPASPDVGLLSRGEGV